MPTTEVHEDAHAELHNTLIIKFMAMNLCSAAFARKGTSMRPNTPMMHKLVATYGGKHITVYSVPAGTKLPNDLTLIHEERDHYSLQPAQEMTLKFIDKEETQGWRLSALLPNGREFYYLQREATDVQTALGEILNHHRRRNSYTDKEADQSCRPVHLPAGHSNHWPSVVVESAYSESQSKLANDARWWLNASEGELKTAITFMVTGILPPGGAYQTTDQTTVYFPGMLVNC
ncbi:hypothetical protein CNMCM5793_009385 [Aspergillus hiratsukae]|uniref:Tse2 ADP-ribosyltransferase toxin domain-containing protein n=1 Tax=Aspergillus hiratsukae TaxID=1194566 RepID=A0A8H6PJC1_9EURO|nr:hypothetical protein CNMCM5793_009385 [Aspergillus hiratsukae]KAF7155755.1 hypothetical protein CNMCM6106_007020 [Aspergillus hiratsukae]KAF7155776.1 hypothetical protein CNMCM6106_007041 [Aspergillus hiratsukae]